MTTLAVPASHGQERLWFIDRATTGVSPSILVAGLEMRGPLDAGRFCEAVEHVVDRHEILRTTLERRDQALFQVVHRAAPQPWRPLVTRDATRADEAVAQRLLRLDEQVRAWRPDLAAGPLLHLTLAELEPDRWSVHVAIHHASADAVTLRLFLDEVATEYRGEHVEPPRLHYADVTSWQRDRIARGDFDADRAFWRERLRDVQPVTWDDSADVDPVGEPGTVNLSQTAELRAALRRLAVEHQTSTQCVLVAALGAALCLDVGAASVAVGVPVDGRTRSDMRRMLGFLVNTVAVPVSVRTQETFGGVLSQVAEVYADGLTHQELPFDEVVRAAAPDRRHDTSPVFQAMVTAHAALLDAVDFPDVQLVPRPVPPPALPTPLLMTLGAGGHDDHVTLNYAYPLARPQAQRLANMIVRLVVDGGDPLLPPRPRSSGAAATATEGTSHGLSPAPPALVSRVSRILAEVLNRDDPLPPDAHFFQMGGHSLLAIEVLDRISADLGASVPLGVVFEHPVVADLAAAIHSHGGNEPSPIRRQPRVRGGAEPTALL